MPTVNIETTNICNANCTFCAYQYQDRPTGTMTLDLFRRVVDQYVECGGGPLGLTPTVGDPLVDKHLLDRLAYAKSKQAITSISMYSNMISLNRWGARALVGSGLSHLVVSTSGFDEEMYQRVYRSKMYKQVFRHIKEFAVENRAAGGPVDVTIDMRIDRPLAEVQASRDYQEVSHLIGADRMGVKFRYDSWAGKIQQSELTGTMRLRSNADLRFPRISACSQMYRGPAVYWDGKVGACACRDVDARELLIGDVNTQHLGEIWFGQELRKLREEFLTDRCRQICQGCSHYSNLSVYLRRDFREKLAALRPVPGYDVSVDSLR